MQGSGPGRNGVREKKKARLLIKLYPPRNKRYMAADKVMRHKTPVIFSTSNKLPRCDGKLEKKKRGKKRTPKSRDAAGASQTSFFESR